MPLPVDFFPARSLASSQHELCSGKTRYDSEEFMFSVSQVNMYFNVSPIQRIATFGVRQMSSSSTTPELAKIKARQDFFQVINVSSTF